VSIDIPTTTYYLMFYHGNYCGPGWSNGRYQSSVVGDLPAVDEFDETCKQHDAAYALGNDRQEADRIFVRDNLGKGFKRSFAAVLVQAQYLIRGLDSRPKYQSLTMTNKTKTNTTMLRGGKPTVKNTTNTRTPVARISTVPAAYGFSLQMQAPKIVRKGNTALIVGSDYAGSLYATNSSTSYEPSASVLINPIYFPSAMLGQLSRTFEKFRMRRASLQYIPSVPTSTAGQVVMTSSRSVKEPFIGGSTSSFLSRALSQGNAVATPIWKEAEIQIGPSEWCSVDALVESDLDDAIAEEIQIYSTSTVTQTAGCFILHYEMEFSDPLLTYHSSSLPVSIGVGSIVTLNDDSNTNATTDAILLNNSSLALSDVGSIYRMVFQTVRSTLPTGPATWPAVAKVMTTSVGSTTTFVIGSTNITMTTGTTLYGLFNGSTVSLYASLESAIAGTEGGALAYQTATTAAGTWSFLISQVRAGSSTLITTQ